MIVCVVSNARSGSTALRSALNARHRFKDYGEIFHNDRSLTPSPFLDFLESWPRPVSAMIKRAESRKISEAYLDYLTDDAREMRPLIDIKHNCWNVLRPLWQFPHDEPVMMTVLKARRALFVQLKRDLADQIISYFLAVKTGVWHRQLLEADLPPGLSGRPLDPVVARRWCALFRRAELLTEHFLGDYPGRLTLKYESVFRAAQLTEDAAGELSNALGVSISPVDLPYQPNAISKRRVVSNYDEIRAIATEVQAVLLGF